MKDELKRFYIFTGKGGVGKTTAALSFCEYLKSQNKNYLFVTLESNKIEKSKSTQSIAITRANELAIKNEDLDLETSVKGYIAKKLGSETVAKWVVKTPFFQSLINMIPGFSYVIYLGYLLEKLIQDPSLIIVLDSPSSGHALTMLESTKNFNQVFEGGVVYDDTKLMLETLTQTNFTQINIITIPTILAINESNELEEKIKEISDKYLTRITCNNTLIPYASTEHPQFLKDKIANEQEAISSRSTVEIATIPHSINPSAADLIKDLVPSMESLV